VCVCVWLWALLPDSNKMNEYILIFFITVASKAWSSNFGCCFYVKTYVVIIFPRIYLVTTDSLYSIMALYVMRVL